MTYTLETLTEEALRAPSITAANGRVLRRAQGEVSEFQVRVTAFGSGVIKYFIERDGERFSTYSQEEAQEFVGKVTEDQFSTDEELRARAAQLGYHLDIEDDEELGGKILYVWEIDRNSYTPEIHRHREFGTRKSIWKIQTTAYGSKEPEDIRKVIEGYERALKMVELLETIR